MTTFRSARTSRTTRATRATRRPAPRSRALMLSTASVAGTAALIAGGYAQAAQPARTPTPAHPAGHSSAHSSGHSAGAPAPATDRVHVEHQVGAVLEGTADVGQAVMVTVYENSLHGSSIQVVLGDPDEDRIGYVEQDGAFITGGVLDVTVDVKGTPVRLHGTVAPGGRPTKVVEPLQDNGEQIVTKGTNTPLATDVDVTVRGVTAPVRFAPAFAFDLETRRVSLGR